MSRQSDSSRGARQRAVTVVSQFCWSEDNVQTLGLSSRLMPSIFSSTAAFARAEVSRELAMKLTSGQFMPVNPENHAGERRRHVVLSDDGTVRDGTSELLVMRERVD